jgi:hypothetical protein
VKFTDSSILRYLVVNNQNIRPGPLITVARFDELSPVRFSSEEEATFADSAWAANTSNKSKNATQSPNITRKPMDKQTV